MSLHRNLSAKTGFLSSAAAAALLVISASGLQAQQPQQPGQQQPGAPGQQRVLPGEQQQRGLPGQPGQQPGQAQQDQKPFTDEQFIKDAIQGNLLEIRAGQMAAQKSEKEEVKEFGEHLAQDHQKALQQLVQIAQQQNVPLPREFEQKQKEILEKLQGASAQEFDQEFAKFAIKSHVKEINQFQKAAKQAENQQLRSYANEVLPVLQQHLQKAQEMAKSVGLDEATIASLMREAPAAGAPGAGVEVERGTEKREQEIEKKKQETEKKLEEKEEPKP